MNKVDRARRIDRTVRQMEKADVDAFWVRGWLCCEMQDKKLYYEMGYKSFSAWMDDALTVSRKTAYESMRVYRALKELPAGVRKEIPKQNAKRLAKFVEQRGETFKRNQDEWIDAATEMTEAEFTKKIQGVQVGAEKEKPKVRKVLQFEEDQWEFVDEAYHHMVGFAGVKTMEEAVEDWAADYMAGVDGANRANGNAG